MNKKNKECKVDNRNRANSPLLKRALRPTSRLYT